ESGFRSIPLQRPEAEHMLIVGERPVEVADLQPDWSEAKLLWQTKSAGCLSVRSRCCRLGGISLAEDVLYRGSHRFLRLPGSFAMSTPVGTVARLKTKGPLLSEIVTRGRVLLGLWRRGRRVLFGGSVQPDHHVGEVRLARLAELRPILEV